MADHDQDNQVREYQQSAVIGEDIPNERAEYRRAVMDDIPNDQAEYRRAEIGEDTLKNHPEYREETAAEIAAPVPITRRRDYDDLGEKAEGGAGIGYVALALSIISLFVMPILFGAIGIVLGFIARSKGAEGIGAWAIGIGAVSIVIGIFVLPFF